MLIVQTMGTGFTQTLAQCTDLNNPISIMEAQAF